MDDKQIEDLLRQIGRDISLLGMRLIRLEDRVNSIEKAFIRGMR